MKEIFLHGINLNLLVVFQALMVDGGVGGAAGKLNKTPFAVSHALARPRDQVGGPILIMAWDMTRNKLQLMKNQRPWSRQSWASTRLDVSLGSPRLIV
jgi:hypothetical protein